MNSYKQMQFQNKRKKDYFEGWYYKLLNLDGTVTLSLIPGISNSTTDPHAFIQIINNYNHQTYYIRFPLSSFHVTSNPFCISIDNNHFTHHQISLNIQDTVSLAGMIELGTWTMIDESIYAPNIMGPFAYIPWMECNHGVMSLRHGLQGNLKLNDDIIVFDNGIGYIEKDYGNSFPSRYIWIHGNKVGVRDSLFFSYATIPFGFFHFNGLICIIEIDGIQHRFATYNNSKVKQLVVKDQLHIIIKKGAKVLTLILSNHLSHPLVAPKKGNMNQIIYESLDGTVVASLHIKGQLVWEGSFHHVASEISGNF